MQAEQITIGNMKMKAWGYFVTEGIVNQNISVSIPISGPEYRKYSEQSEII